VLETSEATQIAAVQQRLLNKYSHVPAADVSAIVQVALARFDHSSVRDFVPLLVERRAGAELAKPRVPVSV
jgi:hypothetical protein